MSIDEPRTGRPFLLTDRVHEVLVAGIAAGLPYHVAAQRAGIAEPTFWMWVDRGRAARRREQEQLGEYPPCPRCLAVGEEPCVTNAGRPASKVHAGRITAPTRYDPELVALVEDLEKAEADAHARILAKIQMHGDEHWQALAWVLERRYPHLYSLRRLIPDPTGDHPPGSEAPDVSPQVSRILESLEAYAAGVADGAAAAGGDPGP